MWMLFSDLTTSSQFPEVFICNFILHTFVFPVQRPYIDSRPSACSRASFS